MKIGFDAKRYFANYTGLGNYSRSLIENLVKYYPDNQYLLYTHRFNPEVAARFPISDPQVSIRTPASLLGKVNSSVWRSFFLGRDLALEPPDIYHGLSHEIPLGIQKMKGLKKVVTIHDLIFMRYPEFYRRAERAVYTRKFKFSCQHADRIVTVSEQTKKDIVQYFETPAEKIETIYQSCDPTFLRIVPENIQQIVKNRYRLPNDFILYLGSFNERKNLIGLIDGLGVMNKGLDVPLVMIGGGKQYKTRVMKQIHHLGLNNRVMIRSDVPNEDLPAIYQLAKLFVYPSIFEGFGI
ncbi:MAG: glycosyltransferase family 4 protein, partial [Deltaproteobacteria bacterium]|nr:glycosyltransferase family 4 protein [Deltaproteobacteria bacterium]